MTTPDTATVYAVVVTHRRPELLAESLRVLAAQHRPVDHLIVVDNDFAAGDPEVAELVASQPVPTTYLGSRRNLGGAGGFALGMLHALAAGIESIHALGEYHGDLHAENVMVQRLGLTFELRLLDLFNRGRATRENRQDDICSSIRLFYDALGGRQRYAKYPRPVKASCCGLKRSLIVKKFRTASDLRLYLETQDWR